VRGLSYGNRPVGKYSIPTLAANRGYLLGSDSHLISAARNLSALMVRHGLLEREDDLNGLVLPEALPGDER